MEEVKYFAFKRNGEAVFGTWWRNALVRRMRNAFFKMHQEGDRKHGILYYQISDSDQWHEKKIHSNETYDLYRIEKSFVECSEDFFHRSTSDGQILTRNIEKEMAYKKRINEEKERAESITYVGNNFIYSDHKKMLRPEKENYYLRTHTISAKTGDMRSFLIEIEGETPTMYKIKLLYLPPGETGWRIESRRISKKKIESAYGSKQIVETTEEELAKHYLLIS